MNYLPKIFLALIICGSLLAYLKTPNKSVKKPYTMKDLYLSNGHTIDGLRLDCKVDPRVKHRHINTIRQLRLKMHKGSIDRLKLEQLLQDIEWGNTETEIERTYNLIVEENSCLKERVIGLTKELNKETSYKKFRPRK